MADSDDTSINPDFWAQRKVMLTECKDKQSDKSPAISKADFINIYMSMAAVGHVFNTIVSKGWMSFKGPSPGTFTKQASVIKSYIFACIEALIGTDYEVVNPNTYVSLSYPTGLSGSVTSVLGNLFGWAYTYWKHSVGFGGERVTGTDRRKTDREHDDASDQCEENWGKIKEGCMQFIDEGIPGWVHFDLDAVSSGAKVHARGGHSDKGVNVAAASIANLRKSTYVDTLLEQMKDLGFEDDAYYEKLHAVNREAKRLESESVEHMRAKAERNAKFNSGEAGGIQTLATFELTSISSVDSIWWLWLIFGDGKDAAERAYKFLKSFSYAQVTSSKKMSSIVNRMLSSVLRNAKYMEVFKIIFQKDRKAFKFTPPLFATEKRMYLNWSSMAGSPTYRMFDGEENEMWTMLARLASLEQKFGLVNYSDLNQAIEMAENNVIPPDAVHEIHKKLMKNMAKEVSSMRKGNPFWIHMMSAEGKTENELLMNTADFGWTKAYQRNALSFKWSENWVMYANHHDMYPITNADAEEILAMGKPEAKPRKNLGEGSKNRNAGTQSKEESKGEARHGGPSKKPVLLPEDKDEQEEHDTEESFIKGVPKPEYTSSIDPSNKCVVKNGYPQKGFNIQYNDMMETLDPVSGDSSTYDGRISTTYRKDVIIFKLMDSDPQTIVKVQKSTDPDKFKIWVDYIVSTFPDLFTN